MKCESNNKKFKNLDKKKINAKKLCNKRNIDKECELYPITWLSDPNLIKSINTTNRLN